MQKIFTKESIKLKSIQQTFCDYDKIKWEFYAKHIRDLLVNKSYRTGRVIYLYPFTKNFADFDGYNPTANSCPEHDRLTQAFGRTIRRTFEFKPEHVQRANDIFIRTAKKMKLPIKDITFVSVHNRRKDHLEFIKKTENKKPLKASYFYDAMDKFREDYDHPAFLFVSDDMEWAKKNVKNKHKDLFYVSEGKPDEDASIGSDLAVIALSNATIVSRGSFSMWGAVLNGNDYYTENGLMMQQDDNELEDLIL